jgi:hypothetical protein
VGTVLTLVAVAVLTVIVLVGLMRQHQDRAAEGRVEAARHTSAAREQKEESLQRRTAVRAAHAERVRVGESDADE